MALKTRKGKKKWFQIIAPAMFKEAAIGAMPLFNIRDGIGRTIKVNIATLTREIRRQMASVVFKIDKASESTLSTKTIGYEMSQAGLKRLVSRRKSKIQQSFLIRCADDTIIRIKPLIITSSKANNTILTVLRKESENTVKEYAKKVSCADLFKDIIFGKLQNMLRRKLNKIVPIRFYEIAKARIEKEGKREAKLEKETRLKKRAEKTAAPKPTS